MVNILWFAYPIHLTKAINVYYNVFFLVIVWLHLNRSLVFSPSIGPFITILVYSTKAVVQFAFLFAEFFIPFVCGFYVMFGGVRKRKSCISYYDWASALWVNRSKKNTETERLGIQGEETSLNQLNFSKQASWKIDYSNWETPTKARFNQPETSITNHNYPKQSTLQNRQNSWTFFFLSMG